MDAPDLRTMPVIVLAGLVPAVAYLVLEGEPIIALSLVSTVIIAASLYYMFTPTDVDLDWAKPS